MAEDCEKGSDASEGTSEKRPHKKARKCTKRSLGVLKDVMLLAFAIVGLISLLRPLRSPGNHAMHGHTQSDGHNTHDLDAHGHHTGGHHMMPHDTRSCNCGNSTAEALKLGCKFDSLAVAWLPDHCRDDELTAEFERSGPGSNGEWTYWADTNHTQPLTLEEVAARDHNSKIHMTGQWHVMHCVFYWRKAYRTRINGKKLEARADTEGHIQHCVQVISNPGYGTVAGVVLSADED